MRAHTFDSIRCGLCHHHVALWLAQAVVRFNGKLLWICVPCQKALAHG